MSTDTGTDCRSHSCNIPANHHPSRACSLALHLGPAPGSQRSPHDLSPLTLTIHGLPATFAHIYGFGLLMAEDVVTNAA